MAASLKVLPRGSGKYVTFGTLVDSAANVSIGNSWVHLDGKYPYTITFEGVPTGDFTVQVLVSNQELQPAAAFDGGSVLASQGDQAPVAISHPYGWVKVNISAWATPGGTISAYLRGQIQGP